MNTKKILGLTVVAMVVILTSLTACTAADLQSLQGIINSTDNVSGNVTVTLEDGTVRTINLADINVQAVKETLGRISLYAGDNVTLHKNNHGDIMGTDIKYAVVEGVIKSLGVDCIVVTTGNNTDITLKVAPNTLIIEKAKGTVVFSTLTAGQKIEALYDSTTLLTVKLKIDVENQRHTDIWGNGKSQEHGNNQGRENNGNHKG
jgi:hypothetical protein